jgi:glyoxylase-like metal-dependent hydrolase (beta-lactamase superfamily II)
MGNAKALCPAVLLLLAGACADSSRVPDLLAQGRVAAPQAVTAVDVSDDGRSIAVTTLAFRQDPNFWLLSDEGEIRFGRNVAPWAPFQAAALDGGKAFGVGLAYSRVTSPYPTISLFGGEKSEETVLEDSRGEWGWLRYGEGEWRSGWCASLLGDLLARTGDSAVTVRGHNGAVKLLNSGATDKYFSRYDRPFRMSVSADGSSLACGYIVPDFRSVPDALKSTLRSAPLLSVSRFQTAAEEWEISPTDSNAPIPELPKPGRDLPELASTFRLDPDALVPFRVAASVSFGAAGRVALAEYGGWLWVRRGPAIGAWNPPYHVIPFVPRQRGRLRVSTGTRKGEISVDLPHDGLFEVVSDPRGEKVWAVPMSWFARGAAGAAWLPADPGSRAIYEYDLRRGSWRTAWEFPDAVSDFALDPWGTRAWVSCWDGRLYGIRREEGVFGSWEIGAPARVRWSRDGQFGVVGTQAGEVLRVDPDGTVRWRVRLPSSEPPAIEGPLKPVYDGIPVYSVGRTGKEHAYVGDTWFVKTEGGGFLVDAGGSSAIPWTISRIRAAGGDVDRIRDLLHTHSHGDHAGAAYLWRARGLRIVAPESAAYALGWLMPMLTDYGVWVPRPVDVPLPLKKAGDETEFMVAGQRIRAVFVPGHSLDSVIYLMDLGGKRVAFTGDVGFQAPSDILHRCWTDADHAAEVVRIVKSKVLPFRPDVVFTGHGGRAEGTAFLEDLVARSEESIRKAPSK